MHAILLSYFYPAAPETAQELLERYVTLTGWAEGLAASGATVTVIQRFHQDLRLEQRGATYHFLSDQHGPRIRLWQIPCRQHRLARTLSAQSIAQGKPTVVHLHGLLFPVQTRALRSRLPRRCALVAQHHAERPWTGLRELVQRVGLRSVDGFMFAARELAKPWRDRRLIRDSQTVYEIMEGSTSFSRRSREAARAVTGLFGAPVVLWVGRLDENKDPLAVLAGFEGLIAYAPAARLYMAFGSEGLLPQVQARIEASPVLSGAVQLLGRVPHPELEQYYNSADFFVVGSHYEGSGYALVEALACGVVPVVTDIPSFRMMTNEGMIGALWPPGNAEGFTAAMLTVLDHPLAPQSAAARRIFEERLSFPAIGRQALQIYHDVVSRRCGGDGQPS